MHKPAVKSREVPLKRLLSEQADNSHYFSDEFQPLLSSDGPTRYVAPSAS